MCEVWGASCAYVREDAELNVGCMLEGEGGVLKDASDFCSVYGSCTKAAGLRECSLLL